MKDLIALAEEIKDEKLRKKVIEYINNPLPKHPEIESTGITIENSPASVKRHHKYPGGLLEHTIAVTKMAVKMAEALEETYGIELSRDLLISGGILHDLMKPQNYQLKDGKFDHLSDFHLDHLTLGIAELYRRDFPLEVIKVVASHHGDHGPVSPDSIEAWLIHHADNVDAAINDIGIRICQARSREFGIDDSQIYKIITPLKLYEMRKKLGKDKVKEFLKEKLEIKDE
ncbi:7,8-dihydroneopterin 2',3'-cyclic phosphate phosphodiesterase [Methanococcus maripaludis]|uniref:7,8-dihydroneopterin 2',3'-cyclic phosphate phosphodiesterase n=1 Tax=Methanococcus maripaludis TaxID=39152 RepID=A0A7J9P851_METMI|nr:HDIG domain-containing metalloprotein [Methanococcus maripaludis]MBA2858970.1 7,8-dihydroneopterin 2',3'-cyclic phosphate phosphodiesterase [Methanococcus maripaludis]